MVFLDIDIQAKPVFCASDHVIWSDFLSKMKPASISWFEKNKCQNYININCYGQLPRIYQNNQEGLRSPQVLPHPPDSHSR